MRGRLRSSDFRYLSNRRIPTRITILYDPGQFLRLFSDVFKPIIGLIIVAVGNVGLGWESVVSGCGLCKKWLTSCPDAFPVSLGLHGTRIVMAA